MKNPNRNKLILVFACLCALCASLFADNTDVARMSDPGIAELRKKLVVTFHPLYKVISFSSFMVENPEIAPVPFEAYRFVLSGTPLKDLLKDKRYAEAASKPEYADIIVIPVKSPFRIDKALQLKTENLDKQSADFFFSKYGFHWRNLKSQLKRYTLYVGRNESYYFFVSSNLSFIFHLGYTLKLQSGFSPVAYLAEALSVQDLGNITAETASRYLKKYGNDALPYIAKEINTCLKMDERPFIHFRVVASIGTPEAFEFMNRMAAPEKSPGLNILLPVFDAIVLYKLIDPALAPCYKAMLREQTAIAFVIAAYRKMNRMKDIRADLIHISENPVSYDNYRTAKITLINWNDPDKKTCHYDAENWIRTMLVRSGETPGSTGFQNIEESKADREFRLKQEDEKRIKIYIDKLKQAPERDLTVITGLNLALTNIDSSQISKAYVERVRAVGIKLLKDMPDKRNEISHAVRTLTAHVTNETDKKILADVAVRIGYR